MSFICISYFVACLIAYHSLRALNIAKSQRTKRRAWLRCCRSHAAAGDSSTPVTLRSPSPGQKGVSGLASGSSFSMGARTALGSLLGACLRVVRVHCCHVHALMRVEEGTGTYTVGFSDCCDQRSIQLCRRAATPPWHGPPLDPRTSETVRCRAKPHKGAHCGCDRQARSPSHPRCVAWSCCAGLLFAPRRHRSTAAASRQLPGAR